MHVLALLATTVHSCSLPQAHSAGPSGTMFEVGQSEKAVAGLSKADFPYQTLNAKTTASQSELLLRQINQILIHRSSSCIQRPALACSAV